MVPSWAKSMVENWKRLAALPPDVDDSKVFKLVDSNNLNVSSSNSEEENLDTINFLRQELGLPPLEACP